MNERDEAQAVEGRRCKTKLRRARVSYVLEAFLSSLALASSSATSLPSMLPSTSPPSPLTLQASQTRIVLPSDRTLFLLYQARRNPFQLHYCRSRKGHPENRKPRCQCPPPPVSKLSILPSCQVVDMFVRSKPYMYASVQAAKFDVGKSDEKVKIAFERRVAGQLRGEDAVEVVLSCASVGRQEYCLSH